MKVRAPIVALVAAASLAGSSSARPAAPAEAPVNLVASPAVKQALRASFLRLHRGTPPSAVRGPLKGTVYYGRYRGTWALATFSMRPVGTTDQPEAFRLRAGRWADLGDNGQCKVPRPLIRLWHLVPSLAAC